MGELMLVSGPQAEPVSVAEAKAQLRVDISDDDTLIGALISSARRVVEQVNGRTLFATTWKLTLDNWPNRPWIELPRPPLASVTSVKYIDTDGTEHTWDSGNYVVETARTPGRLHLAYNVDWPTASLRPASPITITYVAGWSDVDGMPQEYKQAILLLVAHWYENRENVVTSGAVPKEVPMGFEWLAMMDRVY